MSNMPDNFKWSSFDSACALPEDDYPNEAAEVYRAQETYKEIMRTICVVLKSRGFNIVCMEEMLSIVYAIVDALEPQIKHSLTVLENAGFVLSILEHDDFLDSLHKHLVSKEAV